MHTFKGDAALRDEVFSFIRMKDSYFLGGGWGAKYFELGWGCWFIEILDWSLRLDRSNYGLEGEFD